MLASQPSVHETMNHENSTIDMSSFDDGKPPYALLSLIAMAILDAPDCQLTSAQICLWISEKFPYYQTSDYDWRHSVIEMTNQHEAFVTLDRTDDGGCYYHSIKGGCEFDVSEMEDSDSKSTVIGIARQGIWNGKARMIQLGVRKST